MSTANRRGWGMGGWGEELLEFVCARATLSQSKTGKHSCVSSLVQFFSFGKWGMRVRKKAKNLFGTSSGMKTFVETHGSYTKCA